MKGKILFWVLFLAPILGLGQRIYRVEWTFEGQKSELYFQDSLRAIHSTDSLLRVFQSIGYLESEVKRMISQDSIKYRIEEGALYYWTQIHHDQIPEPFWKNLEKPGAGYLDAYRWLEELVGVAENKGYPFASAKLDSIRIQKNELEGRVIFEAGPLIVWDSVSLPKSSKTNTSFLQFYSGLEIGQPFSQRQFEIASQKLRRSKYFTLSGVPELSFQNKSAKPFFPIKERRVNVFDGVIGFLPNENDAGKLLVTGQVDLQLYHLGGKGRDIALQWQRLNIQSQSLELAYREAFIFRSKLDFGTQFSLLKQDSSFVNREFELDFGYQISDSGYLRFFSNRKSGDLLSSNFGRSGANLPPAIDYRWTQYGLRGEWDYRNDVVFPRRGGMFQANFSVGNKRVLENTGIPVEAYEGVAESSLQIQGGFEGEKHVYINPVWGMWMKGAFGVLQNDNLFLNEYFRLGGLKTIRGFNEKFFFAKSFGYLSLEQRLFFGENTYLMAFADIGILENAYNSPKKDQPFSFGTGINLDTGGGLFSFVFALGKSNVQPLSFEYARVHFGYLARF
ncbi:BamA/TamA family outer membrane protein [Algoriphagus mannitolivorans]|uniref:hypothetical protein n=1 Tax=Algoriphagus mannitolivorans TaxID=226504 RepID=UPI000684D6BC|nr:hypothetical protein [Algoriphagus mannitolivorans]